jgi:Caspase domain
MQIRISCSIAHIVHSSCCMGLLLACILIPFISLVDAQTNDKRDLRISQGTFNSWPRKAKRFALIIGVDEYQDSQITKLEGASNDAKMLADALIQYGGFPSDQVVLFTSDQPADRRPTRGNILRRLSNLRSVVPQDGLLLIAFAGHGMERGGHAYLLPTDAQVNGDIALLEETAINADVIKNWVRETGISQIVIILDACRNNPASGRGDANRPLTEAYTRGFNFDVRNKEVNAFVTLYATEIGQVAYEFKEKKQGYFTWALVEGLKGAAANDGGEVTLAGLIQYLQEAVPKRVRLDLGGEKNQRPFAVMEGYKADDLVITVVPRGPSPSLTAGSLQKQQDQDAIELSFWDTIKNSTNPEDFKAYLQQFPNGRFATLAKIRAYPTPPAPSKQTLQKLTIKDFIFAPDSCKLSGGSVTCTFTVENDSQEDKAFLIYKTDAYQGGGTRMFDGAGNEHSAYRIQLANKVDNQDGYVGIIAVPHVAVKGTIRFENVSSDATSVSLLRLLFAIGKPGDYLIGMEADYANLRNIPLEK